VTRICILRGLFRTADKSSSVAHGFGQRVSPTEENMLRHAARNIATTLLLASLVYRSAATNAFDAGAGTACDSCGATSTCGAPCGCDQACGSNDVGCCADDGCRHHYFIAEALFWEMDESDDQAVVLDQNTLITLLSTDDAAFGNQAGGRFTFGWWTARDIAWEASYFGFDDWDGAAVVEGNNDLRLAGDIGLAAVDDFFGADRMQLTSASELHNFEINRSRRIACTNLSWLVGFRYLNFQEDFTIESTDADNSVSNYMVGTENNLYGAQLGGIWRRHRGTVGLEVFGKAGVFANDTKQQQFIGDFGNTFVFRDTRADGNETAFVGEIGATGLVRISERWSLRGGYNLMWIDEVARAIDQLDFTDTLTSGTVINDSGDVFLHGANVGLEARW
jgi:hypothetical protein